MNATKSVVDHHLESFRARDLDGILSDYAPGAVLITPQGPLEGVAAIRPLFEAMVAEFSQPGAKFELQRTIVSGDHAFIVWTAESSANVYEIGTDTFVVRDDRIALQTFAARIVPKRR